MHVSINLRVYSLYVSVYLCACSCMCVYFRMWVCTCARSSPRYLIYKYIRMCVPRSLLRSFLCDYMCLCLFLERVIVCLCTYLCMRSVSHEKVCACMFIRACVLYVSRCINLRLFIHAVVFVLYLRLQCMWECVFVRCYFVHKHNCFQYFNCHCYHYYYYYHHTHTRTRAHIHNFLLIIILLLIFAISESHKSSHHLKDSHAQYSPYLTKKKQHKSLWANESINGKRKRRQRENIK